MEEFMENLSWFLGGILVGAVTTSGVWLRAFGK